ncbi:MAG: hypothetical protein KF890_15000 [Nitrospira sp.]|jgi:hypothetical protein|nr:hypothetical protein [Nitrospira sp.]
MPYRIVFLSVIGFWALWTIYEVACETWKGIAAKRRQERLWIERLWIQGVVRKVSR